MSGDELDRILDSALESYARGEPRPGLEGRVLARVAEARREPRFGWWGIAAVAAVCGGLVLAILLRNQPLPPPPGIVRLNPPAPTVRTATVTPAGRHRVRSLTLPKREQFPTPAPLTAQERAMLRFAEQFPKQALDVSAREEKPIAIPEIEIKPLDDGSD